MDKNKILSDIKNDFKASKTARNLVEQRISSWKRAYDAKPYGNEQKHRSSIVMKDIEKHIETMRPSIVEPFLGSDTLIKAKPTSSATAKSASFNQHTLNYQFNTQFDKLAFIDTISSVLPKEGTVFIRTGWERLEDIKTRKLTNMTAEQLQSASAMGDIEDIEENKDKTFNATLVSRKLKKNMPTAIICRNEDIFTDPTAHGDLEKAKFIFHEYEVSLSDISKQPNLYPEAKSPDVVARLKGMVSSNDPDSVLGSERYSNTQQLGTDTSFVFSSDALKKIKVIEYWGEADINGNGKAEQIVCTFVKGQDIILRLEENPYPDNEIPFVSTPYSREAFTMWGKALASGLEDNQKIRTAIMRGFIDNMALSNNGQKFFQKGAIDYTNMKKLASGYRFIEMNNINGMVDGKYNEMPASAFNLYNIIESESEALSGVSKNMTGLDSATVGRTASGVNMVMSAAQRRTLMTVRNISNMLRKMFNKWAKYNQEFLDDDTVIEINGEFSQVTREMLKGDHDFEIRIGMDAQNQGKMQQINMLMQQLSADGEQAVDQEIRKELVAEFFDAMGKNEQAEKIRTAQPPQPSPEQQQMAQLEMRLKQMEAALEEAKIMQTQSDAQLKQAQAEKLAMEMRMPNADLQKKMAELEMKVEESYNSMRQKEDEHNQKMSHKAEEHRQKMIQNSIDHSKKMEEASTSPNS